MKQLFKKLSVVLTSLFIIASPLVVVSSALHADSIADNVCKGVLGTEQGKVSDHTTISDCSENGNETFVGVMKRIINIFSIVVGAVSVIMIIIGGFRYIISGGDSSGVSGAKNTILYAVVGLIIVLFAQIIVRFVIANLSKAAAGAS